MAFDTGSFIGREVYARDNMKVGTVKRVLDEGDFIVVDQSLEHDLVLPVDEIESLGDRLVVQRTRSYLDNAPKVDSDGPLSPRDRERIEQFFMPRAA